MTPPWVSVGTYSSGFEAEIAAARLRAEDIEVMVRGNDVGLFGAGFQGWAARGWEVLVPDELADMAREALSEARELDDDEGSTEEKESE
jgi:hypothetical protein